MPYVKINKATHIVEDVYSESEQLSSEDTSFEIQSDFVFDPIVDISIWKYLQASTGYTFVFRGYRDFYAHAEYNELSYEDFITKCESQHLPIQYKVLTDDVDDVDRAYYLYTYDGNEKYFCNINMIDSSTGVLDFDENYILTGKANQPLAPREFSTGIIKFKPRPVEGKLFVNHLYFTTGLSECDAGIYTHYWTITTSTGFPDIDNTVFSSETSTGITIASFIPDFDYYIDGGYCCLNLSDIVTTTGTLILQMYLAPAIPREYGGSVMFVGNKRFKRWNGGIYKFELVTSPAFVRYYPGVPSNEIRITVLHDVIERVELEIGLRLYL